MSPGKKPRIKKPPPPPTPKTAELWDLPLPPPKGDPDPIAIYTSVGKALSTWERLEHQMSNIFAAFMSGKRDHGEARWAYGMVMASSARAEMLGGAAYRFFYCVPDRPVGSGGVPGLKAEFAVLHEAFKRFAARRNNIAHGIVNPVYFNGPDGDGYCLVPPLYATKQYRKNLVYPYALTAEMIDKFTEHFGLLGNSAMLFASQLRNVVPH